MNDHVTHELPASDTSTSSSTAASGEALTHWATDNPMTAVLASAAVGAGVVALFSLLTRDNSSKAGAALSRPAQAPRAETASPDLSDLKSQWSDLMKRLTSALPSTGAATSAATDAVDSTQRKANDLWRSVSRQAEELVDQWRPQADRATELAKAHPVWSALAVGAIGALLGSQFLPAGGRSSASDA